MIGWKIVCGINEKDVVAEVASQPVPWIIQGSHMGVSFYVYHDNHLHQIFCSHNQEIKVIERK